MQYTEEQRALLDSVDKLIARTIAPAVSQIEREDEVPKSVMEACGDMGLLQFRVPVEYGGPGGSAFDACLVRERIAQVSAVCSSYAGSSSIVIEPLLTHGSEELRRKVLPVLAEGRSLTAIAITEPDAGSDMASMKTRAVLKGDRYLVSGQKAMISHGANADYMLLFARTGNDSKPSRSLSAFLVEPKKLSGMRVGRREKKMGLRGHPIYELSFEDAEVPVEQRVGLEGDGFSIVAKALTLNRPMIGAMATGLAQGAFNVAVEYARNRRQFGKPIIEHQAIQMMLADMAMNIEASRSMVYACMRKIDAGDMTNFQALSSMVKCFATDTAMKVTTDAVQVLGGYGYIEDYGVERMMRDAKVMQIFEGTNQIQRIIIARELAR